MKHDVSFVTCVYDDLSKTKFAGRHNRGSHYAFSLAQMGELGVPVYCFTDKSNMFRFFPALYRFGCDNFRFISYNLEESPYLAKIQEVKDGNRELYDSISWSTRCVEIMWGKFDWLLHVLGKIGVEEDKYIYWIDGGISHEGVIPRKYNTRKAGVNFVNQSHEYSYMFCNDRIFNADFPDFLVEYAGEGNLLHFLCTHPQHNDKSDLKLHGQFHGTAVGGLFGGHVPLMHEGARAGKETCFRLLENGFITKEEDVLTHLMNTYADHPNFKDRLKTFHFDTWYHEDWDVYNPALKSFSAFFEEFIEYREGSK